MVGPINFVNPEPLSPKAIIEATLKKGKADLVVVEKPEIVAAAWLDTTKLESLPRGGGLRTRPASVCLRDIS